MTTTLIYEPIAHISDDYFRPPKADGSVSSATIPTIRALSKPEDWR
jgi:hypothetical protein